jgi:hypothetical protein
VPPLDEQEEWTGKSCAYDPFQGKGNAPKYPRHLLPSRGTNLGELRAKYCLSFTVGRACVAWRGHHRKLKLDF